MTTTTQGRASLDVTLVCQWYAPEPVTQPGWLVEGIQAEGARVAVLTGVPNYPTGKVVSGYRSWKLMTETIDGAAIHRAPLYPSHDRKPFRRMVNYASWALSSAVFGQALLKKADVVLVYSSPATAALPAFVAHVLFGTPYVLLVQDLWPDSITASGLLRGRAVQAVERILSPMTRVFYRGASRIVVISPGMADVLAERGVPEDKISLVYNWVPDGDAPAQADSGTLRHDLGIGDRALVLMYAGNHGAAQALDTVIEAVGSCSDELDVHLVMVGDGVEKARLRELARTAAASRVHFLDPMPHEQLRQLQLQADVGVVSLSADALFSVTMPSKVQGLLAQGLPILLCGAGDAADVVRDAGAGWVAQPGSVEAIKEVVVEIALRTSAERAAMGRNGRQFFETQMSKTVGARRMTTELRRAAHDRPHRRASAGVRRRECK